MRFRLNACKQIHFHIQTRQVICSERPHNGYKCEENDIGLARGPGRGACRPEWGLAVSAVDLQLRGGDAGQMTPRRHVCMSTPTCSLGALRAVCACVTPLAKRVRRHCSPRCCPSPEERLAACSLGCVMSSVSALASSRSDVSHEPLGTVQLSWAGREPRFQALVTCAH